MASNFNEKMPVKRNEVFMCSTHNSCGIVYILPERLHSTYTSQNIALQITCFRVINVFFFHFQINLKYLYVSLSPTCLLILKTTAQNLKPDTTLATLYKNLILNSPFLLYYKHHHHNSDDYNDEDLIVRPANTL